MSYEDDMTKRGIESLAGVGTDRAAMLAMEMQRGMDRRHARPDAVGTAHVEAEVPPNHTIPATIHQYLLWMEGFIAEGGKPTHFYDYPFDRPTWLYTSLDFAVNGECGARSQNVIVEAGATVLNPNPWKPFGGYGHNHLYLMDGFRVIGDWVPLYSDHEFDPYRSL